MSVTVSYISRIVAIESDRERSACDSEMSQCNTSEWYECVMSVTVSCMGRIVTLESDRERSVCGTEMSQCRTSEWYGCRHTVCVGEWVWVLRDPLCLPREIWMCDVSRSGVHQSDMEMRVWNVIVSYIRVIWVQTHSMCVWCQSQWRTSEY